jgi:outer membrane protein assembly factor BamB
MFVSLRSLHCFSVVPGFSSALILLAAAGILSGDPALAQGTHLWSQSQMEEFEKGTPDGVSIDSDGHLREGPEMKELLTTPSSFVWSVAADKDGHIYIATGTPASVLRSDGKPGEKPVTLFETKDLSVQALAIGPDGTLYAATMPSGKVYKLNAAATAKQDESSAAVVFDLSKAGDPADGQTKPATPAPSASSRYIWDLTFDSSGRLYIATGNPGAVYRIDPSKPDARPDLFFKSDEAHIRTLAWDAKGNLIAGSDGSGLVYRIDPQGKGYVLFQAPRREITSVAVGANGTIYAACVGDKSHNPLPPLPVQGIATITINVVQPQSLQAANSSASIPEGTEIYALVADQAPRKLWAGKDEIVYALSSGPDGLLALSGNRGRIFRIHDDGSYADVGHLSAQQGLSMFSVQEANGSATLIGTGNTGKVYVFDAKAIRRYAGYPDQHEYASDVLDAGAFARFGRIEVEPDSQGYQILTRTGNVEQPVRGWSDWQPLQAGSVASPSGRFLQWKAVLHSGGMLGGVGVNYLPVNSAPVVDDLIVVPGARINPQNMINPQAQTVNITFPTANQNPGITFDAAANQPLQATKDRTAVTVRWAAHDDDGDDLIYSIYLRGDGETIWRLLKDKITDKAYSFDSVLIPDGGYRLKVVASDSPAHTPADALAGEKVSDRFEIDTTPPGITNLKAAGQSADCANGHCTKPFVISFDAMDSTSPIAHAEYSLDAGPWQAIDPAGKISDSLHEHYEFRIAADAVDGKVSEHLITVRAYDRYDNVGVGKSVIPAQEQ